MLKTMKGNDPKKGKIIPFPKRMKETVEKTRDDIARSEIDRKEAVRRLKNAAPDVTEKMEQLLKVPAKLFIAESQDMTSFSSEKDAGVEGLATNLLLEGAGSKNIPMDFADYGIALIRQGSNTYCAFADRERKIIVFEHIGSAHSDYTWQDFSEMLEESVRAAKSLEERKIGFSFVVNGIRRD